MPDFPNELVEAAARAFHENYERLAPDYGYKTREASAVAWEGVPEENRSLMLATVAAVLPLIEQRVIDRLAGEAGENPYCNGAPREWDPYPHASDVWHEAAACGVAAERARWEAKQRPRITHGRHCTCTPCAREDWTNPALAPCGMHGKDCPQEYAPLGAAGDPVPAAALSPEQTTATEPEGSGDAAR